MRLPDRWDLGIAAASALIALAVYISTLAPTVSGEDGGELVAAAYTLGIPHPTGYPLWCLLGKFFVTAVPFGDVAWRANLMSAVFGAFTVFVVAVLVVGLTRNRWAALVGALALAFSREFWEQSIIAEVYTLNAFFFALCVLLLLWWREYKHVAFLYVCAFAYGLSLCNHSIMLLVGPVFVAYILLTGQERTLGWHRYAAALVLIGLGLSIYAYLPLRSRADPPMDWGNPESWAAFWRVVFREQHQRLITQGPRSVERFVAQVHSFLKIYAWEFTPWIGWLALIGVVRTWKSRRPDCTFLVSLFTVVALGAILIPNFDLDRKGIWVNTTYWIPAYAAAAVFIGVAVAGVMDWSRLRVTSAILGMTLGLASVLSPLFVHYHHNNRSEYYFVRDYGLNLLSTMDKGAVYFGGGDHTIFPLVYLQVVEGTRPDVLVANKYGYLDPSLFENMPESERPRLGKRPSEQDKQLIFNWFLEHTDRPVYSALKRPTKSRQVLNAGLLYRYAAEGEAVPQRDYWSEYSWHTLDDRAARGDLTAEYILYEYHFARGRWLLDEGRNGEAAEAFELAADLVIDDEDALNNLGTICAENALFGKAEHFWRRALDGHPHYVLALRNLGVLYVRQGRFAEALAQADQLSRLCPGDADAETLRVQARTGLSHQPDSTNPQ